MVTWAAAGLQSPNSNEPCGRDRPDARTAGAEGATAPETLRQKDRRGINFWKAVGAVMA